MKMLLRYLTKLRSLELLNLELDNLDGEVFEVSAYLLKFNKTFCSYALK